MKVAQHLKAAFGDLLVLEARVNGMGGFVLKDKMRTLMRHIAKACVAACGATGTGLANFHQGLPGVCRRLEIH